MDDVAQVVEFFGFDDGFGTEIVLFVPGFVLLVQLLDVGKRDGHFGLAAAFFDASTDAANGTAQVNEEIGGLKFPANRVVELHVGVVVAFAEPFSAVEVFDEDFGVFVDGSVEDDAFVGFLRFEVQGEFARQVEDLRIKSPSIHIFVEVGDIGVVVDGFVERLEAEFAREKSDHRRFSGADVAGNGNKSCGHGFPGVMSRWGRSKAPRLKDNRQRGQRETGIIGHVRGDGGQNRTGL